MVGVGVGCASAHLTDTGPSLLAAKGHGRALPVAQMPGPDRGIRERRCRVDGPGRPREVGGRTSCARCHTETSFRDFPKGFDHAGWTGFALEGAHGTVGCTACHAPLRKPDAQGRTWGRAKGNRCADCHDDPHVGQFRVSGITDCQRCHRSAMSFSDLTFRHDIDSRFRLGQAHAKLACATCHTPMRFGDREVVRYRPIPHQCSDCHESQKDPLRRGGK